VTGVAPGITGQRPARRERAGGVVDAGGQRLSDDDVGDTGGRCATGGVVVGDDQVRLGLRGHGVAGVNRRCDRLEVGPDRRERHCAGRVGRDQVVEVEAQDPNFLAQEPGTDLATGRRARPRSVLEPVEHRGRGDHTTGADADQHLWDPAPAQRDPDVEPAPAVDRHQHSRSRRARPRPPLRRRQPLRLRVRAERSGSRRYR
jgi:hypothetical protein